MKKRQPLVIKSFITTIFLMVVTVSVAQCSLNITPSTTQNIVCGESVDIVATGFAVGAVLSEDFNGQTLGPGWATTQTVNYSNPCGPSLDGTPSAWMGNTATQPRTLSTIGFDLQCGAEICFDLDFAGDEACGGCSSCEDPDLIDEGVYFEYSTDGGATWSTIFYFEPASGQGNAYYQWANYCFDLPAAGWSANTMFRWRQEDGSSANFDHWGIDNVTIQPYACGGGTYDYIFDGVVGVQDSTVTPTTSQTYDILFTNFTDDTCSQSLTVNVSPFNVFASALSTSVDCGDCTTLIVQNFNSPTIPGLNYDYSWTPAGSLNDPTISTPQACPTATTTYTATMTEPNSGCTDSYDVTITVNLADPGFSYAAYTHCADVPAFSPSITGTAGGDFSSAPAGLVLDAVTGEIDPTTSTAGTYDVTYEFTTPGCQVDSTVSITINPLPNVDAGQDQTICDGELVTLTASGAQTYDWDNGVVNGQSFTPSSTQTYTVTGTDANNCENTDQVQVAVNPADDPTFNYSSGAEYCPEDADPIATISGTPGGEFSYSLLGGGPDLVLNSVNGSIDVSASDPGNYGIKYSTYGNSACPDSSQVEIIIHPSPDAGFSADQLMGCEPVEINFTADQQSGLQSCFWNFDDGNTSTNCYSAQNTYLGGLFDVSHTVVSDQGCQATETYTDYIDITLFPEAKFFPSPAVTNIEFTEIEFNNRSENSATYSWNFGDGSPNSSEENPTHVYPEVANEYIIYLTAVSPDGLCIDSTSQTVIINDVITFYVPNVFTPNDDEFNNTFAPIFTSGIDYYNFHLIIFNRWGETMFETYDPTRGWNGHYGDGGVVPDGVYIWQVEFKERNSDKRHQYRGHVTVLK
ncbi:MAG: gliding motility-associated C-terminal domain-containing protein [Crocinitomicaceae bacterium]